MVDLRKEPRVIVLAQEEARQLGHNVVGTEHILLGLIAKARGGGPGLQGWGSV